MNYSVIIPHHNTPELLIRLIKSIPERDDLEIIIVDDNSDPEIVNESTLSNVIHKNLNIIFNKEGRGAGFARNLAIEHANGKWLLFADSDDYFSDDLNDFLETYKNDVSTDMVVLNAIGIDENNHEIPLSLNKYHKNILDDKHNSKKVILYQYWTPWSKMVKREIFLNNNIKFAEVPTANDAKAMLLASFHSKNIKYCHSVLYYYYKPTIGSQTDKKYNKESYLLRMDLFFWINQLYKRANYPYEWPIMYVFRNKEWNKDPKAVEIKSIHKYNGLHDFRMLMKYLYAKFRNII